MKKKYYFQTLLVGSLFVSGNSFSQKMNETQAAMDFKKYAKAAATGNMEDAKAALERAKTAVDAASEHPETKESAKNNFYKGEIYMGLYSFNHSKNDFKTAIEAYKKSYTFSDKFHGDIQESIGTYKRNFDNSSYKMYNDSLFAEAADNYYNSVELLSVVGQIDTAGIYYSGVAANQGNLSTIAADRFKKCAELGYKAPNTHLLASQSLRKEKRFSEAKELILQGRKSFPNDRGLLLELVNTAIETGDSKGAESSLVEALAADPTNKQLYYVIGTIYMDLKQSV